MTIRATILFVQDRLSTDLPAYLRANQYDVGIEVLPGRVVDRLRTESPDLLVVDCGAGRLDCLELCKKLRERFEGPIMIVADECESPDEISSLEAGASGYASQPVSAELFLARVRSLLRNSSERRYICNPGDNGQSQARSITRKVNHGPIEIDPSCRTVLLDRKNVDLTTAEFDLLWLLAQHPGETVTRDKIYTELKGMEYNGIDRSMDLRVTRLRKKLGENGKRPALIKSIRSVGYMLVNDDSMPG